MKQIALGARTALVLSLSLADLSAFPHTAFAQSSPASEGSAESRPAEPLPALPAPAPPPPSAPEPETGLRFRGGGTVGLSIPFGSTGGHGFGDAFGIRVPLVLDFGASFAGDRHFVAAYIASTLGSSCWGDHGGSGCLGVVRFGLVTDYHFAPKNRLDPWIGYGAGFELSSWPVVNAGYVINATGIELGRLMAGIDFHHSAPNGVDPSGYSAGIFLDVTATDYFKVSAEGDRAGSAGSDTDKTLHMWFTLGIRTTFISM